MANRINPHEVCSNVAKNGASSIQLLFPPYKASNYDGSNDMFKKCGKRIRLVRKRLPGVFEVEYQLPNSNESLTLENDLPSVLQFPVGVTDVGGSLVVELGVNHRRLSGIASETVHLKACLSHGKRIIPTLSAHFDPYSEYSMNPGGGGGGSNSNSGPDKKQADEEELALCPGGRLISLNVSSDQRSMPSFRRVLVPYPAAGEWFLTLLPSCSNVNVRRGNQQTYAIFILRQEHFQ